MLDGQRFPVLLKQFLSTLSAQSTLTKQETKGNSWLLSPKSVAISKRFRQVPLAPRFSLVIF
jgi:hypothetical protein